MPGLKWSEQPAYVPHLHTSSVSVQDLLDALKKNLHGVILKGSGDDIWNRLSSRRKRPRTSDNSGSCAPLPPLLLERLEDGCMRFPDKLFGLQKPPSGFHFMYQDFTVSSHVYTRLGIAGREAMPGQGGIRDERLIKWKGRFHKAISEDELRRAVLAAESAVLAHES